MNKEAMKLQEIMSQAQVFASAWSLVGGRFDGGNAMDEAEVAKNELYQMVAEALAQPQQEPVAWANPNDLQNFDMKVRTNAGPLHTVPLYTYPLARKPLTDEQIINLFNEACREKFSGIERFRYFARAIEAAHGIKGTT